MEALDIWPEIVTQEEQEKGVEEGFKKKERKS